MITTVAIVPDVEPSYFILQIRSCFRKIAAIEENRTQRKLVKMWTELTMRTWLSLSTTTSKCTCLFSYKQNTKSSTAIFIGKCQMGVVKYRTNKMLGPSWAVVARLNKDFWWIFLQYDYNKLFLELTKHSNMSETWSLDLSRRSRMVYKTYFRSRTFIFMLNSKRFN